MYWNNLFKYQFNDSFRLNAAMVVGYNCYINIYCWIFSNFILSNIISKANPYFPAIFSRLIKWLSQTSLSINHVVKKPAVLYKSAGENREDYFLNVKRIRGKERPKNCQGRLKIFRCVTPSEPVKEKKEVAEFLRIG
jgi:hypothetical protein